MAVLGDVIVGARGMFPDPAQTIAAPVGINLTNTSGSLVNGLWTVQATVVNRWGQSLASTAVTTSLAVTGFTVTLPALPSGGVSYNVFFYASGTTQPVYLIPLLAGILTVNITTLAGIATVPNVPVVATAYLPDTDGGFVTAFQIYDWINGGLNIGALRCEGFLDIGGVQAVSGQGAYAIDPHWKQIDHAFFDGWPLALGTRDDIFRHSTASGITGYAVAQRVADQIVIETYPQPNRTGATTTLGSPMTATDTTLTVSAGGLANFLPFGILQVSSGGLVETISYGSISGNVAGGLIRGICGTVPLAWSAGAVVTEFNLRLEGRRYPETYAVGSSLATLRLPPGMDEILKTYLLYKFKTAEQNWPEAKDLYASFLQEMDVLETSSRPAEAPTQLRGGTSDEAFGIQNAGRLVIP